jgi:hypothetical protein
MSHGDHIRSAHGFADRCSATGRRRGASDEDKPGVVLDHDEHGNLVSLEILDASRRVTNARRIEYQTTH